MLSLLSSPQGGEKQSSEHKQWKRLHTAWEVCSLLPSSTLLRLAEVPASTCETLGFGEKHLLLRGLNKRTKLLLCYRRSLYFL